MVTKAIVSVGAFAALLLPIDFIQYIALAA